MPQKEITNKRPTNYGYWHREKLSRWCYQTDGDFFEQRFNNEDLTAVAYIETVQIPTGTTPEQYPIWESKVALANEITKKMQIPGYFVWHYENCKIFFVQRIGTDYIMKLSENEYRNFIMGLKP
jgi:hypothetical protein